VPHLVYSFAIGGCSWGLTSLLRHGASRWLRQRLGEPSTIDVLQLGLARTLPLLLLGAALGAPLGLALGDLLTGNRSPSLFEWQSASTRMTLALTVLASLVVAVGIAQMQTLAHARAAAEAAKRQASEMQLKLLQAQLEPHMLFNTLANLRVLIGMDPPRAQAMLDHLIAFLRATLSASRSEAHTLAAEFERVADYLALMSMRMGPRLAVTLDLPAELREAKAPPMLLQPLVENSIRHGLEPQLAPGCIEVSARAANGQLVLTVRDTGVGLPEGEAAPGKDSSFGLAQIRARLATLYGAAGRLTLTPASDGRGGTLATVSLPLAFLPESQSASLPPAP
jgi:LytS/YehU family sensor histidine kinase